MAISLKRYVDIVSGVGAGANVGQRKLIGRFFDDNALIPTGSHIEFDSASDVAAYFGSDSAEYARAAFWFGWVSKNVTDAQAISFARWNSAASAPQVFGARQPQSVTAWNAITAGAFSLTLNGVTNAFTGLDFSGAVSLAGVAAIIQAAINAKAGAMWSGATVVYNALRGRFELTGGVTGPANVIVIAGTGGADIAAQLGWLSASTILSFGAAIQSITDVLSQSSNADNNFGSFAFTATLTQSQVVEAATWNDTQNNMFMYSVPVSSSNATALAGLLAGLSGVTLTLNLLSSEYAEQVPMMILAATDYTKVNATQNFMFQQFALTPTVKTDADANTYDLLNVNYYGETQTAGQIIRFYQRGYMMGLSSDATDQNTYSNEIWLKDAAGAAIMTLLLALAKVSANLGGKAQIMTVLQSVIDQAVDNGTISVGKTLTTVQKLYITNATNDPTAWKKVQNIGYWYDVVIQQVIVNNRTEYKAVYTLIYSKDDVIRKVEGQDILI